MIDLSNVLGEMQEDIDSVKTWTTELYDKYFSQYFEYQRELYDRLESKEHPVTDEELEWILTSLPLELFSVSEQLSQFQLSQEVIKLRVKQTEKDKIKLSTESSETKRKEDASYQMLEHKLLLTVYDSVIDRVSREISFSRELIMSAKKIWDARRRTDGSNPVSETVPDNDSELPEYAYKGQVSVGGGKTYVK